MSILREKFGVLADGREVTKYTLVNARGVKASFLDLGAIWHSMEVPDRYGRRADVILGGFIDESGAYVGIPGEIVGRNANRIGGARFTLDGKEYRLAANDGENNLHSGPDVLRNRMWEVYSGGTIIRERLYTSPASDDGGGGVPSGGGGKIPDIPAGIPELFAFCGEQGDDFPPGGHFGIAESITFALSSPHMDQGYPGNAQMAVTYVLTDDNSLLIHYHMVSDMDTVANMTNHAYFNLAGHGSGVATGQWVWIDADSFTPTDRGSIPTGEIAAVEGTPMDFRVEKPIGGEIDAPFEQLQWAGGYDHNWVLKDPESPGEIGGSRGKHEYTVDCVGAVGDVSAGCDVDAGDCVGSVGDVGTEGDVGAGGDESGEMGFGAGNRGKCLRAAFMTRSHGDFAIKGTENVDGIIVSGKVHLAATARDPVSGRKLEVYTDLPGMQFYTGNFIPAAVNGKDGATYTHRGGYCFETQYFPDAVNKPQFEGPFLKAGEIYSTSTVYRFVAG
ncbi:MAG: galactose mutarotase [Lachnospiraceae bacterium]|jgi:aldose 1-epimerase|nr:galactose mutarotase [Lachnospiraceae bacterium]